MPEEDPPRVYTRAEADALVRPLTGVIDVLRETAAVLADESLAESLAGRAPGNGGGPDGRGLATAALRFGAALQRLNEWGVVVRDLEHGICDFPAVREGRPVWLCWRYGEERVGFWHDHDTGFAGRRPLDEATE